MALTEKNTLKQFGISLQENKRLSLLTPQERYKEFRQNLEAYANEVLEDQPVSNLYHYWPNHQGKLFTDPSLKSIFNLDTQFDPNERDDLPRIGFSHVAQLALASPDNVVLWYSPKGPASFDQDPQNPYSQIIYDYGQLYIQYFDGEKINAVAIKITNEEALRQFSSKIYEANNNSDLRKRISNCLLNPIRLSESIDDFLARDWVECDVYRDKKKGGKHFLSEVIKEIKTTFAGLKRTKIKIPDETMADIVAHEITEKSIFDAYLQTIHHHQQKYGLSHIGLSGSCGGSTVTTSEIENLLGIRQLFNDNFFKNSMIIHSSSYRLLTQGGESSGGKWEYHNGRCRVCDKEPVLVGPCSICVDCEKKFSDN